MGMYASVSITIGARSFEACARHWGLPCGTYDDYSYSISLTARECKAWVDRYYRFTEDLTSKVPTRPFHRHELFMLTVGSVIEADMTEYICKQSSVVCPLESWSARRQRLRKATRAYRFCFV